MPYKRIFILFLILPVILLSISGCTYLQEADITPPQPEKPQEQPEAQPQLESPPEKPPAATAPELKTLPPPPAPPPRGAIIVELSFSEPPVLGKPVEVLATFTIREGYNKDTTNSWARISLDEGFELVDGNLEWKGDLLHGSSVEIKATVRAIKTGERKISAKAKAPITSGFTELYAYVSEDSAEVSDIPLGPTIGHGGPTEPPPGWKPPPGYEDVTPEPPSEPPEIEPPAQDVEPVDIQ